MSKPPRISAADFRTTLEWLADEWRHRWPLAPEEILGGANAHIFTTSPDSMERDIIGRPLMRDGAELTKRLSRKQRHKLGRNCYHVDGAEYLAARLANWEANIPVGRTEKTQARNRAFKARMVESLKASLPLSRQYHAETQRLREVSGANAARQRVAAAKSACEVIEAEIGQLPALTMTGLAIKATLVKAMFEASNLQNLGGFFGDSYRLVVAVLDVVPASSV